MKPREFWIAGDLEEDSFFCVTEYNPPGHSIHVIEKAAADKLAAALEWACGFIEGTVGEHQDNFAEKALKEYRGEK